MIFGCCIKVVGMCVTVWAKLAANYPARSDYSFVNILNSLRLIVFLRIIACAQPYNMGSVKSLEQQNNASMRGCTRKL